MCDYVLKVRKIITSYFNKLFAPERLNVEPFTLPSY